MRLILAVSILMFVIAQESTAQSCPNVHFKTAPSAILSPSTTTRLNLIRQADGSYTSYETGSASPYALVGVAPHFEKQLTACVPASAPASKPAPVAPSNPVGSPPQYQAIALLPSGNYLVVAGLDAALFDPQMNLLSEARLAAAGSLTALADLNGDGNLDIVSVINGSERGPGQLTILLGNGGLSFQAPVTYQIPASLVQLTSFTIGDLNGDHKLDIAVAVTQFAAQTGSIMTFLGNGDGTFQPGPTLTLAHAAGSLALADLNNDGKLDIAVTDQGGGSVAIALGKGDGTFAAPNFLPTAPTNQGTSIAIGDMNGDSIPDIVTPGSMLFGDGKGNFPTRQDYIIPPNRSATAYAVILTDFDGDGRMDVVIADGTPAFITGGYASAITVLFGLPDGTWFAPSISTVPGLGANSAFNIDQRTADFNGDGIPDIVYAGSPATGVMLGKGDGTFAPSFSAPPSSGWYLATGDFNGDGHQDFVSLLPYPPARVSFAFFAGKGDGTFQSPLITSLQGSPAALVSGDFDGDGKLDLAILFTLENDGTADQVIVYLGNGDGTFRHGATYPTGPTANWMVTGDLNNDGKPDLIVSNAGSQTQIGNVSTLLGKGDGTCAAASQNPLPVTNAEGYAGSMTLADFNHDGKLDLALTIAGGFAMLPGNGDGTFQPALRNSLVNAQSVAAVDLDGDGIPDLIALGQLNNVTPQGLYYLIGNGDGSFQPPVSLNIPGGSSLVIADLNRDGKPDLVSSSFPLGFFSLLNLTSGTPPFKIVNAATLALGPVAADSFVSALGTNLPALSTIVVTDSTGVSRTATALYTSSTQINFVMPAGTSPGAATVNIDSLSAQVDIVAIAPGLFTENATGLAAAYAVRVDAQGNQSVEPVFTIQNGVAVATPISLGSTADQVYLILYGTGFDTGSASATVAGQTLLVTYAGPQGLPGLDQVNILVPHGLAGRGDSPVVLSVAGATSNTVHITIQ